MVEIIRKPKMRYLSKYRMAMGLLLMVTIFFPGISLAEDALIMTTGQNVNIREGRSTSFKAIGVLFNGERVKAAFLDANWYAIFPLNAPTDDESTARGYVYAPLLTEVSSTPVAPPILEDTAPGYAPVEASTAPAMIKPDTGDLVSIDFKDVDLRMFIKFISELTKKNFVIDPRVRAKVTIISPSKLTVSEAYNVFESVLEVHGFTTVEAGEVVKIVRAVNARTKSVDTLSGKKTGAGDKIVTQLITLKNAKTREVRKTLTPFIPKTSILQSYEPSNMLIITDFLSNIKRLKEIIEIIDVPGTGRVITIVPLEYALAKTMESTLTKIFKSSTKKTGKKVVAAPVTDEVSLVSDERTNSIVMLATERDTEKIKQLISMLDKAAPRGSNNYHVYYCENATAEELAKVLQSIPDASAKKTTAGKSKKETKPVISKDVRIQFDAATNSLIITANKNEYDAILGIIEKLDIPRSMVYIECLIMEVNIEKDFEMGTEWMGAGRTRIGTSRSGGFSGGFINETDSSSISSITPANAAATGALPSGFSMGIFSETLNIAGIQFPNLAAMVKAFKKDEDIQILSTPQILTSDNAEAKIYVGSNVPIQTKTGETTGNETYTNYEYKDVGITLTITPHISKDRLVRLKISQEVNKLESAADDETPTTLKRTIDTTVIVKDKNTVVIGGLIDDSFSKTTYKVPCLGDVPILGWAFKNMVKGVDKTNLYIFLTPHVIKSPAEAGKIYDDKKTHIDRIKEGRIKLGK